MKNAIIVGCNGQDGQLLTNYLVEKGYSVTGIDVDKISGTDLSWNKVVDISNKDSVFDLLRSVQPDHVYYLAAHHHSSQDDIGEPVKLFEESYKVNVFSYLNFLEGIREFSPTTKIFYASSSHIFGVPLSAIQDESTPFNPNSAYAISKLDGLLLSRYYRNTHSIFTSVGILYNHESHLRADNFVSKRIVKSAVQIKMGIVHELVLGDINAEIDWGYAGDYVEAMSKILDHSIPDDYVIASGNQAILKDFISMVFEYLDLDWKDYVEEDPSLLKRMPLNNLFGNSSKLINEIGWKPKIGLKELAKLMVDYEQNRYISKSQ